MGKWSFNFTIVSTKFNSSRTSFWKIGRVLRRSMVAIAIKSTLTLWDTNISWLLTMAETTAVHVNRSALVTAALILLIEKPTFDGLFSTVRSQWIIIFMWGSIRGVILILVLLPPHRWRGPVMFVLYRRTVQHSFSILSSALLISR